ncbi:MAG: hypothetical protein WA679_13920, partial [Pseudolabrys sp.]
RCSALRLFGAVGLPSKAANGLNTGLGDWGAGAPWRLGAGIAGLAVGAGAGGVAWACDAVGRADGRGTWAMAGAVKQANNATNASLQAVRL